MPAYELSLVFKTLKKPELSAALKRVGKLLLDQGKVLQKIENHGSRNMDYRIIKDNKAYDKGSYFVYYFVSSQSRFLEIKQECSKDVDILKYGIFGQQQEFTKECTLEEELKCPAERESVQKLLESGKRYKERTKIRYRNLYEYEYFDKYM